MAEKPKKPKPPVDDFLREHKYEIAERRGDSEPKWRKRGTKAEIKQAELLRRLKY